MKCEICSKPDPEIIVILSAIRPDGCLNTLACLECAEKSNAYCVKHETPHLGFVDDSTACRMCVEETLIEKREEAEAIFRNLEQSLPTEEMDFLINKARIACTVTGDKVAEVILRFFITKAMRLRLEDCQGIVDLIKRGKSTQILFH